LAAAQTSAPAPAASAAVPVAVTALADLPSAPETRRELSEVLHTLPPAIGEVLRYDPSLLTRADYLTPYPRLAAFLQQHPEVARNPAYFLGAPDLSDRDSDPNARGLRLAESVLDGVGVFVIIGTFLSFFVWVVRTVVDHRRWLRQSKIQVDVHTKVLDRLSTHDDLLAYIQSPSGRRFLDSAPIELDGQARPTGAALGRVLWSLQAGVVLLALGGGFWLLQGRLAEAAQGLSIISTLAMALGLGFVAAAAISYAISMRHGLIGAEVRAQHE
jgi:hypothetical protein